MGAVIDGAATARPSRWPLTHGARHLADAAATSCLRAAAVDADELDLLINVGVYRERGLSEPALAALLQEHIGANLGQPLVGGHGTFSFDLDNGACGVLSAAHVMAGFLAGGAARRGLVVASDSAPGPLHVRRMPYPEVGGALLLSWDDRTPGFVAHRSATYPEFEGLAQGYWAWQPRARLRPHAPGGHNTLVVSEKPGFHQAAVDCAAEVVHEFLADLDVPPSDVDLLVATHGPGFADALADRVDIPHRRVVHVGEDLATAHTAEPIAAIATARHQRRWAGARTILLVAAGAGVSVAASLYRN